MSPSGPHSKTERETERGKNNEMAGRDRGGILGGPREGQFRGRAALPGRALPERAVVPGRALLPGAPNMTKPNFKTNTHT